MPACQHGVVWHANPLRSNYFDPYPISACRESGLAPRILQRNPNPTPSRVAWRWLGTIVIAAVECRRDAPQAPHPQNATLLGATNGAAGNSDPDRRPWGDSTIIPRGSGQGTIVSTRDEGVRDGRASVDVISVPGRVHFH
jgi:hypothetical protein